MFDLALQRQVCKFRVTKCIIPWSILLILFLHLFLNLFKKHSLVSDFILFLFQLFLEVFLHEVESSFLSVQASHIILTYTLNRGCSGLNLEPFLHFLRLILHCFPAITGLDLKRQIRSLHRSWFGLLWNLSCSHIYLNCCILALAIGQVDDKLSPF